MFSGNPYLTDFDTGLRAEFDTVVGSPVDVPVPGAFKPSQLDRSDDANKYVSYIQSALADDEPLKSVLNGAVSALPTGRGNNDDDGDYYVGAFKKWHESCEGPWGACINFLDTHTPFQPKKQFDLWGSDVLRRLHRENPSNHNYLSGDRPAWESRAFEALYDGTIRQTDTYLRSLVKYLENEGELDDTLVIVTSDHGEGFAEQVELFCSERIIGHQPYSLNEEITHVPLIVNFPGQSEHESISEPASLTEFPSVVKQTLRNDAERSTFVSDRPVLAQCTGAADWKLPESEELADSIDRFNRQGHAVYEAVEGGVRKSVVVNNRSETFLIDNKFGKCRIPGDASNTVAEMLADIKPVPVRDDGDATLSEGSRRQLEELGYLA